MKMLCNKFVILKIDWTEMCWFEPKTIGRV